LWTYLGDRLGVDPGEYSVDKMGDLLAERDVPVEIIQNLKHLLDTCAMESYAPENSRDTAMGDVLEKGREIVSRIERVVS